MTVAQLLSATECRADAVRSMARIRLLLNRFLQPNVVLRQWGAGQHVDCSLIVLCNRMLCSDSEDEDNTLTVA